LDDVMDDEDATGGSNPSVDVWAVAPGDTVTYWARVASPGGLPAKRKACVGTVLVAADREPLSQLAAAPDEDDHAAWDAFQAERRGAGLLATLTVWDGRGEVQVEGSDVQTRLAAPPRPTPTRVAKAVAEAEADADAEASFAALRAQLAAAEEAAGAPSRRGRLDSAATSVAAEKLDAERTALARALLGAGGGTRSGADPAPMDPKAALQAQLAAAKEFIKNHELEKSFREKSMREKSFREDAGEEEEESDRAVAEDDLGTDEAQGEAQGGGWAFCESALGGCFLAVHQAAGGEELPVKEKETFRFRSVRSSCAPAPEFEKALFRAAFASHLVELQPSNSSPFSASSSSSSSSSLS
jgi:hypothetical protein